MEVKKTHNLLISSYNSREETLIVTGTSQQIGLLLEICESLKRGTLIQDMRRVLRVSGESKSPSTVAYSPESWNPDTVASGQPPGTPPLLDPTLRANLGLSGTADVG